MVHSTNIYICACDYVKGSRGLQIHTVTYLLPLNMPEALIDNRKGSLHPQHPSPDLHLSSLLLWFITRWQQKSNVRKMLLVMKSWKNCILAKMEVYSQLGMLVPTNKDLDSLPDGGGGQHMVLLYYYGVLTVIKEVFFECFSHINVFHGVHAFSFFISQLPSNKQTYDQRPLQTGPSHLIQYYPTMSPSCF